MDNFQVSKAREPQEKGAEVHKHVWNGWVSLHAHKKDPQVNTILTANAQFSQLLYRGVFYLLRFRLLMPPAAQTILVPTALSDEAVKE
jgi:hypothetical protein